MGYIKNYSTDWLGKEVSSQQLASSVSRVKYVLTVMLLDESEYNMSVIHLLSTLAFSHGRKHLQDLHNS